LKVLNIYIEMVKIECNNTIQTTSKYPYIASYEENLLTYLFKIN